MSLDHPEYEELKKKNRLLGYLWRIGDTGYYLGLIGTIICPLAVINHQLTNQKTRLPWNEALLFTVIGTAFCFCIFWSFAHLKNFALNKGNKLKGKP